MINKRKKKNDAGVPLWEDISIDHSGSSGGGMFGDALGEDKADIAENDMDDVFGTRRLSKTDSKLKKRFDKQVAGIQEASDDRAAAEESNLDILDRGSRYTRQNKKLKKFKDAQNGKK